MPNGESLDDITFHSFNVTGIDDGVSDERTENFCKTAMATSAKYQKELQKSQKKLNALHDSLEAEHGPVGALYVQNAMAEHASELLTQSHIPPG